MILLWVVPSLLQNVWADFYNLLNGYTTAFASLVGVVLMCIIRIDKKPLVSITEAITGGGVPFSSLIMCAGTLALGSAMTNDAVGLVDYIQTSLSAGLGSVAPFLLLFIFVVWAIIQTNFSSNMVTATVVTTVAMPIMLASSGNSNIVAVVACLIGMLSAFAFMTPPSMPHIAIASGSVWSSTKDFLLYGLILAILTICLSISVGYFVGMLVF